MGPAENHTMQLAAATVQCKSKRLDVALVALAERAKNYRHSELFRERRLAGLAARCILSSGTTSGNL